MCVCERERDRDRVRDRQTETGRHRESQTQRETDIGQREKETDRQTDRDREMVFQSERPPPSPPTFHCVDEMNQRHHTTAAVVSLSERGKPERPAQSAQDWKRNESLQGQHDSEVRIYT